MINISFDKRIELLFGLQYCLVKEGLMDYDSTVMTNKEYCDDFYNMYKKYANEEFIDYIKNGGFDTYNRTLELAFSLDKNYNIIDNEYTDKIEKNNSNFNKEKFNRLVNEFVIKSGYEEFYLSHKPYYDKVIEIFKENLNKFITFDEKMITDFYGFKLGNMKINIFNFSNGSFGANFNNELIYVANVYPPKKEDELVYIPNGIINTLFHEYSHSYCNPLGYKYFNEESIKNIEEESRENGLENCYNGITVINEYMVRAVQEYLSKKYLPKEYYNIEKRINWHKERGYIHINDIINLLDLKDDYESFEDFYKEQIVSYFNELNNVKLMK